MNTLKNTALLLGLFVLVASCGQTMFELPPPNCTVTQLDEGVKVSCSNGTSGFAANGKQGAQGQTGNTGSKGDTGTTGAQGVPGNSVTTVKFCDDYIPVYPSSFPEYGLCIDNKLYGVYYSTALGVFLAYLPPGQYRSTNNSQACIFTVTTGCEISP